MQAVYYLIQNRFQPCLSDFGYNRKKFNFQELHYEYT